ncbi:MAG TPA: hypothetical protein VGK09_10670 [Rhodocyclaceae bacterium]|jgi:hypothetical protein
MAKLEQRLRKLEERRPKSLPSVEPRPNLDLLTPQQEEFIDAMWSKIDKCQQLLPVGHPQYLDQDLDLSALTSDERLEFDLICDIAYGRLPHEQQTREAMP